MKKQKQTTIQPKLFGEQSNQHKLKQVSPPETAKRNGLTGGYDINMA